MSNSPIKIVIADDNRFFCDALKDSLNQHEELDIIDTFVKLNELVNFVPRTNFDVLILDINFNGKNSLDYVPELKTIGLGFKIIALTTMNNDHIRDEAYKSGVDVFMGKDGDLGNFKNAIIDCLNNDGITPSQSLKKINIGNWTFTKRKLEILQALYEHSDKKEKEISLQLNITEASLKSHKRELFEITNTKNTPELIKFGIQQGLIIA